MINRLLLWAPPLVALVLGLPLFTVVGFLLFLDSEIWHHLIDTVLNRYLVNTLLVMAGVTIGTLSIGIITAWLTTACRFPGQRFFAWALLLPLALPAYIIAYTYIGLLDIGGPIQTSLRQLFGWGIGDYTFPEIRSRLGAVVMLSLVLYPYVYLLTRTALREQAVGLTEVSRTLGLGPWATLWRLALPMARPAIVAGLSLALMETLADYGTMQLFGVDTFTTGIFRTWYGFGDIAAAAQLAALLLAFVFVLLILERYSRRKARYQGERSRRGDATPIQLRGWGAAFAFILCLMPLLLGFIIPLLQLGWWGWLGRSELLSSSFTTLAWNSLSLAAAAALLAIILALLLGYARRLQPTRLNRSLIAMAGMGYAIPGAVIAVGVMIPLAALDNLLDSWLRAEWGVSVGLILSGTLVALIFGYMVRFLTVALSSVESGLLRIRPALELAARSLGRTPTEVLLEIHLPLLRRSLLAGMLLVFVEVLKELPATLIMRPFNFNTLAVRAYEMAANERLVDAALPALAIVAIGLLPILLLHRAANRGD
jgi:iron(III) transport system permease protein